LLPESYISILPALEPEYLGVLKVEERIPRTSVCMPLLLSVFLCLSTHPVELSASVQQRLNMPREYMKTCREEYRSEIRNARQGLENISRFHDTAQF
jgi:hypothetical protein